MTEDQAREKWCPMVRMCSHDEQTSYNRDFHGAIDGDMKCIASDCMMWRPERKELRTLPQEGNTVVTVGGYCGLVK